MVYPILSIIIQFTLSQVSHLFLYVVTSPTVYVIGINLLKFVLFTFRLIVYIYHLKKTRVPKLTIKLTVQISMATHTRLLQFFLPPQHSKSGPYYLHMFYVRLKCLRLQDLTILQLFAQAG
jgi:hypothetical protein